MRRSTNLLLALSLPLILSACGDDTVASSATDASASATDAGTSDESTTASSTGAASTSTDGSSSGGASTTGAGNGTAMTSTASTTTGSSSSTTQTSGETETESGTTGAPVECVYPVIWPAAIGSQASVEAALSALSPGATMMWHDDRGTLTHIQDLEIVLPCDDNTPLWQAVFAFLEEHPDIFQVDGAQWIQEPEATQCQHVTESIKTFNTSRAELGDWAVFRDALNVRLYRNDQNEVVMRSMGGTYLPAMPQAIYEEIESCLANGPAPEVLEDKARAESYPYISYLGANQICMPAFMGDYAPDPADVLEFTGDGQVDWYEAGDGTVVVTIDQRVELIVDEANVTEALAASNAACPDEMQPGIIVGFWAYLDLVDGTVANKGAGLGCIVC